MMETIESLCARYEVDLGHARHVAALALSLFDALAPEHGMAARDRELLEAAALLHNVALSRDSARHHTLGRDIVMAAPLTGFEPAERAILACMVAFHRKPVAPDDEPIFASLSPAHRARALALSALLRVADGLDYSQTQTTFIEAVDVDISIGVGVGVDVDTAAPSPRRIRIQTRGPRSHSDAARANKKADLWNAQFAPLSVAGRLAQPGLAPGMTLAEAGRLVLRWELDRLAPDEWRLAPGERLDPQRIARLSQATRNLRAVLPAFEGQFRKKGFRPVAKGLASLAERAEALRVQAAQVDAAEAALQAAGASSGLLADWRAQRDAARDALADSLAGGRHARWLEDVQALCAGEFDRPAQPGRPSRVSHAARLLFFQRLSTAQSYDALPDPPPADHLAVFCQAVEDLRAVAEALREVLPAGDTERAVAACQAALVAFVPAAEAHAASVAALRWLGQADVDDASLANIVEFAEGQQRLVDDQLRDWRRHLEPLQVL